MRASECRNTGKAEPSCRLSVPRQKTSSEIVNEARNALRTLGTRRPLTPAEDQRKLFGSSSSRAPQNRPPSVFSLHASSFDLAEPRPVSGVRLCPLDHKPVLPASVKDGDSPISIPKPPADAAEVGKVSRARARLFRRPQQSFLSAEVLPPDQNQEKLESEEPTAMSNLCRSPKNCLAEQRSSTAFSDESRQLICNEHISRSEREDLLKGTAGKGLFQLRGGSRCAVPSIVIAAEMKLLRCFLHSYISAGVSTGMADLLMKSNSFPEKRIPTEERDFLFSHREQPSWFALDESLKRMPWCSDPGTKPGTNSSWPRSTGCKRPETVYFGGLEGKTRINEWEEEEIFWHMKILPVLHELDNEDNIENLCLACTKLYQALSEGNLLGKRFEGRSMLLKRLYKLVDIDSDPLRLKLAKIILAMKVAGKNLLSACKLAFHICRNGQNDSILQQDRLLDCLLEVLRTADLQKNNEALLYCTGAVKFLSGNAVLLNEMINKGAVEMLLQLMKQINNIKDNERHFSSLGHLLVQLTATLRNLADCPAARQQLLGAAAAAELSVALELRAGDSDVSAYILRTFSKLSSYDDFCAALADCSRCYNLFLALLNDHQKQQDLVVRVLFVLGNLTAKNNQAREQLFKAKGSVNTLTSLFRTYHELDLNAQKWCHQREGEGRSHPRHPSAAADVLIKLIRVLANLSVHPSAGAALAAAHPLVELLVTVLESKSIDDCEELVTSAATAIGNLSYYQVKSSAVQDKKLHLAEMLLKLLMSNNLDGAVEAVRVFGNLSQHHEVCDFILQKKAHRFMIALLDSKNQDVCFSACGVLLNLTADKNKGTLLMEEGGIGKLVECLQDFGPADWQLACLICKTLWNYSENITSAASWFGEETNKLLVLLTSLLDEELVWDCSLDRDLEEYPKLYWEREFKPVAEKLLHRIQSHHSS